MTELLHILDRASIHFTAACSLVLMLAILLRYLSHHTGARRVLPPMDMKGTLLVSALVVCLIAFLREPFDVASGQSTTKAVTDYLSWFLGTGFSWWGLYRWRYFDWRAQ